MRRYFRPLLASLLLFTTAALATTYTNSTTGQQSPGYVPESTPGNPVSASNPLPTTATTIPPLLTAYGTLSVSTSSIALSTLTVGPNSPAWVVTPPKGYITLRNSVSSANILYFCPLGGTCSASVGEPIAIGEAIVRNLGTSAVSPTVISAGTSTVIAEE